MPGTSSSGKKPDMCMFSRSFQAPGKGRTSGVRPGKVSGKTATALECTFVRVQGCSLRAYLPMGPSCCLSALPLTASHAKQKCLGWVEPSTGTTVFLPGDSEG